MAPSIEDLLRLARRPRILVLGDVMLDRYVWGDVGRISPEAPIPVLSVAKTDDRLGGAGSVATMLAALEADVAMVAVVGDDLEGRRVVELADQAKIQTDAVLPIDRRPTTVKQRLLGWTQSHHPQQMIRIDRECQATVDEPAARRLLDNCVARLSAVDLVVVSDYGKGACPEAVLGELIPAARRAGVPVIVDPAPGADYTRYRGCTCITPNRTEAAGALRTSIDTPDDGLAAAASLLEFGIDSVLVTLDRDGTVWADTRGARQWFSVRPREVCDITGAGDMVAAALCYAFALGADPATACRLANLAAGLEVERLGVVPVTREELLAELKSESAAPAAPPLADGPAKIVTLEQLRPRLAGHRAAGRTIAMTNGCFDLLHPGHVASLQFARRQGDCLIVGLNSDASVRRLKGPGRPLLDENARAAMLAALACVDYVVMFDETSVESLVGRILPDVLVKAAQYTPDEVVGREIVEAHGGRVVLCPVESDYSTTRLLARIRQADSPPLRAREEAA